MGHKARNRVNGVQTPASELESRASPQAGLSPEETQLFFSCFLPFFLSSLFFLDNDTFISTVCSLSPTLSKNNN